MKHPVYNTEGKEVGNVTLPERVFGAPWNADLVHQVVVSMQANARQPYAHTKDRGDVRGGGRKPWRQKGTGRARHGSRRSPIWVGGGVTHGPRKEKVYTKKINKKMRTNALYAALSQKLRDGEIIFVDALSFAGPKTREAKHAIDSLSSVPAFASLARKKKNAALIAIPQNDAAVKRSFKNIGNVCVEEVRNLNPVSVLSYKYVVLSSPEEAITRLSEKGGAAGEAAAAVAMVEKTTAKKKPAPERAGATKKATTKAAPKKASVKAAAKKTSTKKK